MTESAVSYAVDIVHLSKKFRRKTVGKGYSTIKSSLFGFFKGGDSVGSYTTVLQDLTLRIPKGSSVGIIGKNGSGKSTFLKLITGIYKPDTGAISVNGRLAALIELGAGFHPDFSGRENLFLGGVMHGLKKKEIEDRFDDIVSFAELEDVIDDPVRTYSSGMFMRLGFSLAVHTNPDILIVDEVLAVGDARFVSKCKDKVEDLRREGKTLILVTHDMDAVERWCDEALWLNDGEVKDRGDPRRVIDSYRQFVEHGEAVDLKKDSEERETTSSGESYHVQADSVEAARWGSREVSIETIKIVDATGAEKLVLHPDEEATIEITFRINQKTDDLVFGIGINRLDGTVVHGTNTDIERVGVSITGTQGSVKYTLKRVGLLDGSYTLDVAAHKKDGYPYDYHKNALKFAVRWPIKQVGIFLPEHEWEVRSW